MNTNYFEIYHQNKLLLRRFSDCFESDTLRYLNKIKNYKKKQIIQKLPKKVLWEKEKLQMLHFM